MKNYDVTVIGGGPAGLAAASKAKECGASVLLVEREERLGGILKQCIHDGFGNRQTGPEYAEDWIEKFLNSGASFMCKSFVTSVEKNGKGFSLQIVCSKGIEEVKTKALVLSTGCRERTSKQVGIHGTRPAGIFTAGTAQNLVNVMGLMPTKRCVILGSGDIGLIMARRLTLEGAQVEGVYEIKETPSGLTRNIVQCLNDYKIPLHLAHTVTQVFGDERLEAVEVCPVDGKMNPITEKARRIECDALILSVGLIPENEIAEQLAVEIDPKTKGPICNENLMTSVKGVFCCGNALHVNDLVTYVTQSGEIAGSSAYNFAKEEDVEKTFFAVNAGKNVLYVVPQKVGANAKDVTFFFRTKKVLKNVRLTVKGVNFEKKLTVVRPPEMETVLLKGPFTEDLEFSLSGDEKNV